MALTGVELLPLMIFTLLFCHAALLWLQVVRAPVALALVKLLRLMPPEAMRAQLPRVLQGVANLLRNRLQRIRWGLLGFHHGIGEGAILELHCWWLKRMAAALGGVCQVLSGGHLKAMREHLCDKQLLMIHKTSCMVYIW